MSEYALQKRAAAPPPASRSAAAATPAKLAAKAEGLAAAPKVQALAGMKKTLKRANRTGLPDRLKASIEAMSGVGLDHVRVRYNSAAPAAIDADAFAQGGDIHLSPGQEHHLPHEAWHVVQQAQGRVRPTMRLHTGAPLNDDHALEREADVMGARAAAAGHAGSERVAAASAPAAGGGGVVQGMLVGGGKGAQRGFLAARRYASSSGGGGGGGDDHWKHMRALAEMKKAEREAAVMRNMKRFKLIPRVSAVTHGPNFGYLKSTPGSLYRATVNDETVLRSIDLTGFTSPAVRAGQKPPTTPPEAEEITAYSGVKGKKSKFKTSRLVGLDGDVRHTVDVASRTHGRGDFKPDAKVRRPKRGAKNFGRLDEVRTENLNLGSVLEAFRKTGEQNKFQIAQEFVSPETISPAAFGHTSYFPLWRRFGGPPLGQPGQVHPDYLANLGRVTEATDDAPQAFDIVTRRRPDPRNPDRHIEIDEFVPQAPRRGGPSPGREAQYEQQLERMRKKLKNKQPKK